MGNNIEGPMGRAAYQYGRNQFRVLLSLPKMPDRATVSWMQNRVNLFTGLHPQHFTLHGFKELLGIKDDRGEVIEVNITPSRVIVVMSDRELSHG